jgi:hypothetical protein
MFQNYKAQIESIFGSRLRRSGYLCMAVVLILAVVPFVLFAQAGAYNQVSNRSVKMSSTASAATNVAYEINFTTVTNNQTIGSVVVEFCDNSPIIGDVCTAGTGFLDTNFSTLTISNNVGNITGLSVSTANSTSNRLVLTRSAGTVANGAVSITLGNGTTNGITNPTTTNQTFYARILTVANTTGTMPGSPADENNATDAGGVALSTSATLRVTAKVQESLRFCVFTGADCAEGGAAVTLGDTNGVLENNATTYTSNANFHVASNAVSGVVVRLKGDTLKSGIFSIDPAGASCLTDPTASNTEMFGLRMSTLGTGMFADAPYNCASGAHGFDNNNTTGTTSIFGHAIAHTAGATDIVTSTIEFAAKSAITSEAGVYYTDLTLVATATY